jgi:hypothetical protein
MEIWELLIRESVRDTIARYNNEGDFGNLPGLAACFTPDGVMAIKGREPFEGRDAIVAGLTATLGTADGPTNPDRRFVHHHVAGTHFLSLTTERVETSSYFAVHTPVGLDHWGRYRDELVPDGDAWLFARRRIATDGFAPDSLFGPSEDDR